MNADVVCIGQAVLDCIIRGQEERPYKKNVYRAKSIGLSTGGDALNEAVLLTHMGHKVRLVCGVGEDVAGNLILDEMNREKVDIQYVTKSSEIVTPVAALMVKESGTRSSVNSEATMLGNYLPEPEVVKGAKIVSLASLFRAPLDRKETVISLVKAAKEEGAIVCADTKMPSFRPIALSDIREILPYIDYIFPNEIEAAWYTGQKEESEMAKYFRDAGVRNVIIKMGEKGCLVYGQKEHFSMPAYTVPAVDSTGAGDNFVAGFLSGLLQGDSLRECCEKGTACAAISVQAVGATAGIKSIPAKDLEKIIQKIKK